MGNIKAAAKNKGLFEKRLSNKKGWRKRRQMLKDLKKLKALTIRPCYVALERLPTQSERVIMSDRKSDRESDRHMPTPDDGSAANDRRGRAWSETSLLASGSAESQNDATNNHSHRNDGAGHFSRAGTSNNDSENLSTNDVTRNCNQPARKICQRQKDPNAVLQEHIDKFRQVCEIAIKRANKIKNSLAHYLEERPLQTDQNNTRDTSNSTSISSTSQSRSTHPVFSNRGSVRRRDDQVGLIETSGTSGRRVQNQNSDISQPNRSNSLGNRSNQSRNPNNTTDAWGNIDNNDEIVCYCNKTAIQLTVRKEEPNKGRLFYKCVKPQGSGCNFFLWASDNAESQNDATNEHSSCAPSLNRNIDGAGHSSRAGTSNNDWGNLSTNDVMCNCNQPARKLTVQKDGPNKGRQVYGCPKGMNSTCNFFKWGDDVKNTARGRAQKGNPPKRPRLTEDT